MFAASAKAMVSLESHALTAYLSDLFVMENTVSFVQKRDSRLRRSSTSGVARACGARHFHFFGVPLNAIFCPGRGTSFNLKANVN